MRCQGSVELIVGVHIWFGAGVFARWLYALTSGSQPESYLSWGLAGIGLPAFLGGVLWLHEAIGDRTNRLIRLRDAATGRPLRSLPGHTGHVNKIVLSPDGRTVASMGNTPLVRLSDVRSSEHLHDLDIPSSFVEFLVFSRDGASLAAAYKNTVYIWDVATGEKIRTLEGPEICSAALSPDGQTLAGGSSHGTVFLWNMATGEQLHRFQAQSNSVSFMEFSPNGGVLAIGGITDPISFWDPAAGEPVRRLEHEAEADWTHSIAFSPAGTILESGHYESTRLWDVTTGRELCQLKADTCSFVRCLAFSRNGKKLVEARAGDGVYVWEVSTRRLLHSRWWGLRDVEAVGFSPDGSSIAANW